MWLKYPLAVEMFIANNIPYITLRYLWISNAALAGPQWSPVYGPLEQATHFIIP